MPSGRSRGRRATCSTSGCRSAAASSRRCGWPSSPGGTGSATSSAARSARRRSCRRRGGTSLAALAASATWKARTTGTWSARRWRRRTSRSSGVARRRRCRGRAWAWPSTRRRWSVSASARRRSLADVLSFTAGDGYVWRYRRYPAVGEIKAHVVGIHGIQSHGGWYENSCSRLAEAGFEVSFLDRRGAGLNEQDRGDCPSFRRLLDDIAEFLREKRKDGRKVFLMAISWGGKLAAALPRRHPGLVDGLALLCPGMCPKVGLPLGQRLALFFTRLVNPTKLYDVPLSDPALFTANPERQQFIRDDQVGLRQATARLLLESARLDAYLRLFAPRAITMPVLVLLAEHDRIIDNAATRRYVENLPSQDKQIIEYPGAHHTLEFEPAPERFLNDLQLWFERQR